MECKKETRPRYVCVDNDALYGQTASCRWVRWQSVIEIEDADKLMGVSQKAGVTLLAY